jgi:hypothetical protein
MSCFPKAWFTWTSGAENYNTHKRAPLPEAEEIVRVDWPHGVEVVPATSKATQSDVVRQLFGMIMALPEKARNRWTSSKNITLKLFQSPASNTYTIHIAPGCCTISLPVSSVKADVPARVICGMHRHLEQLLFPKKTRVFAFFASVECISSSYMQLVCLNDLYERIMYQPGTLQHVQKENVHVRLLRFPPGSDIDVVVSLRPADNEEDRDYYEVEKFESAVPMTHPEAVALAESLESRLRALLFP